MTITRLQSELQRKSGVWLETDDLWARLGELYDLEALDELVSAGHGRGHLAIGLEDPPNGSHVGRAWAC